MTPEDVDFAVWLTDQEGWGYSPEDFFRFMRMDPEGTLVAWEDSRRVGITTATSYGQVAWIGNVIVIPEGRGRGYGRALVETALEYCTDSGAETCWLNAYTHVVPFYKTLGFQETGSTVRMEGSGKGSLREDVRLVHSRELGALAAFDRRFFGADRLKVLREFYHDYGDSFFIWSNGDVRGYVVGARYKGGVDVAPWVCDPSRPQVAEALLLHLLSLRAGERVGLNVPEENEAALGILRNLGFKEAFKTVRMYHGKGTHGINTRGVFGLGGLEKG
jgi:ribosomal protein S18 acetylase RimI-like enzyme